MSSLFFTPLLDIGTIYSLVLVNVFPSIVVCPLCVTMTPILSNVTQQSALYSVMTYISDHEDIPGKMRPVRAV